MYLDLSLGSIPKAALRSEKRKDFFRSPYYQVDMDAVIEIDIKQWADPKTSTKIGRVLVKLVCGDQPLISKVTQLNN
jgi:hypothetical protein